MMMNFLRAAGAQLKNMATEPNNENLCPVRIIALVGTLQGLGMEFYSVIIQHAAFDIQQFGIGLGAVLTTAGIALGMKKDNKSEATPAAKEGAQ
jgi:hypothetical protein